MSGTAGDSAEARRRDARRSGILRAGAGALVGALIGLMSGCAATSDAASADSTATVPARAHDRLVLFDGRTLDGWRVVGGGATFAVADDCIVGTVGPGPNTFLRTIETYADFDLTFEFRWDEPVNSGVQVRSHQRGRNARVTGYQCELDPSARAWTGGIYDEGRRGWLAPLDGASAAHAAARAAVRLDDWNEVRIEARGARLRTWVNGVPCAVLDDGADAEGFIALQVHAADRGQVRWRRIVLTPRESGSE